MMQSILILLSLVAIAAGSSGQCPVHKVHEYEIEKHGGNGCSAHDRAKCPEYRQIEYMLLKGCKPVYKKHECCAKHFDCPEVPEYSTELDEKCFCNGKVYEASETDLEEVKKGANCHCFKLGISCAQVKCGLPGPLTKGDWPVYGYNKCCPIAIGNSETHPTECSWKDVTAREGEVMSFSNKLPFTCQKCLCNPLFKSPFGPGCQKQDCFYQLGHTKEINDGCVPIFEKNACCGSSFFCPTDERIEDHKKNYKGKQKKKACNFGPYSIPVGKKLILSTDGMKCQCLTPPDIICTRKEE